MDALVGFVALWFTVAMLAWMLGGQRWGGAVFASPFRLFGAAVRTVLGAAGRGVVRLIADTHDYFMQRWPGATIAVYATIIVLLGIIGYLSG